MFTCALPILMIFGKHSKYKANIIITVVAYSKNRVKILVSKSAPYETALKLFTDF